MLRVRKPFTERIEHKRDGGYKGTLIDHFSEDGSLERRRVIVQLGQRILEKRTRLRTKEGIRHVQDVYNDRGQYDGSVISLTAPILDHSNKGDKLIFDLEAIRKGHQKTVYNIASGRQELVKTAVLRDWLYNANFSNPIFESPTFIKNLATCLSKAEPDFFKLFNSKKMESLAEIIANNVNAFYGGLKEPQAFHKSLHAHRYFFAKELEAKLLEHKMSKETAQMYVFKITGVNLAGEGRIAPGTRVNQ